MDENLILKDGFVLENCTSYPKFKISNLSHYYLKATSCQPGININGINYYTNFIGKFNKQHLKIQGNVFEDLNSNCVIDSTDGIVNREIKVKLTSHDEIINTDENGIFQIYVDSGFYSFAFPNDQYYFDNCMSTNSVNIGNDLDSVKTAQFFLDKGIISNLENILVEEVSTIHLFPNPVKEKLYVEFTETNLDEFEVKAFDFQGRNVYDSYLTNQKNIIDVSSWNKGIYFVQIINNTSKQNLKIIKQ